MRATRLHALLFAALLMRAMPAGAQSSQGAVVGGSVSAAIVNGGTGTTLSGAVGYRVNRALGFGVEFTSVLSLEPFESEYQPLIERLFDGIDSRLTMFTTNVRLEMPTVWPRVFPFMVGGGGVASLKRSYQFGDFRILPTTGQVFAGDLGLVVPGIPSDVSQSTIYMALTLGGGASLLWTDHLSVDIDGRVISLHGSNGGTIGRFGAGISYRF